MIKWKTGPRLSNPARLWAPSHQVSGFANHARLCLYWAPSATRLLDSATLRACLRAGHLQQEVGDRFRRSCKWFLFGGRPCSASSEFHRYPKKTCTCTVVSHGAIAHSRFIVRFLGRVTSCYRTFVISRAVARWRCILQLQVRALTCCRTMEVYRVIARSCYSE